MLLGIGILSNSLFYVAVIIPVFLFIYQSIVLAEENFLIEKFGEEFNKYCQRVNRWIPRLKGIGKTFSGMEFKWKRWILKEHTTQFIWLCGIVLILFLKYPQLSNYNKPERNYILETALGLLILTYILVRYFKKSGKMVE